MKVIIVGTGPMARSVAHCLRRINKGKQTYELLGFIGDRLPGIAAEPLLGSIGGWLPVPSVKFIMGLDIPAAKEAAARTLKSKGAVFTTIIAPEVLLADDVRFGEGCVIMTPFVIDYHSRFGDFVTVKGATVAQNGSIGDYSTLNWFANTTTARIGKRVYLGTHGVVLGGAAVGDDAYIDVGSIVIGAVDRGQRVSGYPARKINLDG